MNKEKKPVKAAAGKPAAKKSNVELVDESEEIITLYDSDNKAIDFYQIACVEYEDEFYAVLQPVEAVDGLAEDEAVVLRIEEESDEFDIFVPVESEEIMDKVFNEYLKAADESEENN